MMETEETPPNVPVAGGESPESEGETGTTKNQCRLCASGLGKISPFENDTGLNLAKVIFDCVSIKISDKDVLPKLICEECLSALKFWLDFKKKCIKSHWSLCSEYNVDPDEERAASSKEKEPEEPEQDKPPAVAKPAVQISVKSFSKSSASKMKSLEIIKRKINGCLNGQLSITIGGSSKSVQEEIDDMNCDDFEQENDVVSSSSLNVRKGGNNKNDGSTTPDSLENQSVPHSTSERASEAPSSTQSHEIPAKRPRLEVPSDVPDPAIIIRPIKIEPPDDDNIEVEDHFMMGYIKEEPADHVSEANESVTDISLSQDEPPQGTPDHVDTDYCKVCNRWYSNHSLLVRHFKSKLHKKSLSIAAQAKRRNRNPMKIGAIARQSPMGMDSEPSTPDGDARSDDDRPRRSSEGFSSFGRRTGRFRDDEFTSPAEEMRKALNQFDCDVCNTFYKSKNDLERHFKSMKHQMNLDRGTFVANNFMIEDQVRRRLRDGKSPRLYECNVCRSSFGSRCDLERHYSSQRHRNNLASNSMDYKSYDDSNSVQDSPPLRNEMPLKQEREREREPQSENIESKSDKNIFACPIEDCDLKFSTGFLLICHMKAHGIVTNLSRDCLTSNFKSELKDVPQRPPVPPPEPVTLRAESPVVFQCERCDQTFGSIVGKSNHMRVCPGKADCKPSPQQTSSTYCALCGVDFKEETTFENHVHARHKGARMFKHILEKRKAAMNQAFMNNPTKSGVFKCKSCPKIFNFPRSLAGHMFKVHRYPMPPTRQIFTCKVCGMKFYHAKRYGRHLRGHYLPETSHQFFCVSCCNAFDTKKDLTNHKLTECPEMQMRMKIYSCNICNHSYNNQESLDDHKATEHGPSTAPTPVGSISYDEETSGTFCHICNKDMTSRGNLNRHMRTVHAEQMGHQMETEEENVQGHIEPTVATPAPQSSTVRFTCRFCNRSMSRRSYLLKHMSTTCPVNVLHYKKCTVCDRFLNPKLLDAESKCNICSSAGTSKTSPNYYEPSYDVRETQQVNMALPKRVPCDFCDRTFTKNNYKLMHIKQVHPVEYANMTSGDHLWMAHPMVKPEVADSFDSSLFCTTVLGGDSEVATPQPAIQLSISSKKPCDICNALMRSKKDLDHHRKTYKGTCKESGLFATTHSCTFCGKTDLYTPQLYKHIYHCVRRLFNTGSKILCPGKCELVFDEHDSVKEVTTKVQEHILQCYDVPYHMSQNPEDVVKRALCYLCCAVFTSPENMREHINTTHYGLKPKVKLTEEEDESSTKDPEQDEMLSLLNEEEGAEEEETEVSEMVDDEEEFEADVEKEEVDNSAEDSAAQPPHEDVVTIDDDEDDPNKEASSENYDPGTEEA